MTKNSYLSSACEIRLEEEGIRDEVTNAALIGLSRSIPQPRSSLPPRIAPALYQSLLTLKYHKTYLARPSPYIRRQERRSRS